MGTLPRCACGWEPTELAAEDPERPPATGLVAWFERRSLVFRLATCWSILLLLAAGAFALPVQPLTALGLLAAYLAVGWVVVPSFEDDFGVRWGPILVDRPFDASDDWNRMMATLALLLAPAKLAVYGLRLSLAVLTGR